MTGYTQDDSCMCFCNFHIALQAFRAMRNQARLLVLLSLLPCLAFAQNTVKFGSCVVVNPQKGLNPNRKALLIGNSAYTDLPPLKSPVYDALTVSKALLKYGFSATLCLDLGKKAMDSQIGSFLSSVGSKDEVVFYYSGHAAEIFGQNHLFPVDFAWPKSIAVINPILIDESPEEASDSPASPLDSVLAMFASAKAAELPQSDADGGTSSDGGSSSDLTTAAAYEDLRYAEARTISLSKDFLGPLTTDDIAKKTKTAVNIIIIDACRTEVFRRGKGPDSMEGLAPIIGPQNTYVAFAAAPNEKAHDGSAEASNSPFTAKLLEALKKPNLIKGKDIDFIFREVRNGVWAATGFRQHPWSNVNLSSPYYLVPQ